MQVLSGSDLKMEDFAEWIREQPKDALYCRESYSQDCPLARWIARRAAATRVAVSNGSFMYPDNDPSRDYDLPEWAKTFVFEFDETLATQKEALAAIERTERRHPHRNDRRAP